MVLGALPQAVTARSYIMLISDVIFDLGAINEHGGKATSTPTTGDKINAITIYNWLGTTGTICCVPNYLNYVKKQHCY